MKKYAQGTQKARILEFFQQRSKRSLKELLTLKIADYRSIIRYLRNDGWIITHTQHWGKNFFGRRVLCVDYTLEGHIINKKQEIYDASFSPLQKEEKKSVWDFIKNIF
jgi:hypothetical protein